MSKSTLSSVVSNLVRAQMGSSVGSTVTDDDLDRHVAELILKEAKQKAERYGKDGIRAYLAKNLDSNAPKTNKRFLSSIIRSTDDHNKSILRAQALAAQEVRIEREEQERRERRARAEEAVEAERLRRGRRDDWADNWSRDRRSDRKRRERSWEKDDRGGDRERRSEKRERRHRHRSRSPDRERERESRRHRRSRRSRSRDTHKHTRRDEGEGDKEPRRHRSHRKRSRSADRSEEEEEGQRRKRQELSADPSQRRRHSDQSPSSSRRSPSQDSASSRQRIRRSSRTRTHSPSRSVNARDPSENSAREQCATQENPQPFGAPLREDELRAQLKGKAKLTARSPSPPSERARSPSPSSDRPRKSSQRVLSRSPSSSRTPERSHKSSRRRHRRTSPSPSRSRSPSPVRERDHMRAKPSRRTAVPQTGSSSSHTLDSSRAASRSRSRSCSPLVGPASPGPALPSKMDKYFDSSYDPRLDVAPLALPTIPSTGLISDAEFEGWDAMLEIIRLRRQDKEDKKAMERWGISKDKGTANEQKAEEVSALDIKYKKRGSVREWDMGKEGF